MMMESDDCIIGIDVGGTKIAAGVLALDDYTPLAERQVPTQADRGGAAVLDACAALVGDLMHETQAHGRKVRAIGVGVPELVAPDGRITSAYNFDWRELPVKARLDSYAPTMIEADVRAASLAEARLGAGRGLDTFAYVSIGTGISFTLVQRGVPYAGAHGYALILASGALTSTCPACGTTHDFVLEEYASGAALARHYNEAAGAQVASAREIFEAARRGDRLAHDMLASAGSALGVSLGFMVNLLDPGAIIVGGGLGLAGGLYRTHWVASMRAHIWSPDARDLPILDAQLGAQTGWIGAALSAYAHP